jgi:hypothetical protein
MHGDPPMKIGGAYENKYSSMKCQLDYLQSGLETPQPPDEDSAFDDTIGEVAEE